MFDLSAGLSAAGGAISKTAGDIAIETQKAELEKDKITLADQLAGQREEKQRQFTTSERRETQTFQGGENDKNRTNAVAIANIGADAAVKSAGIHAGGAITAAQIGASSSAANLKATLEQNKPLIDSEVLQRTIKAQTDQNILDARKALDDATTTGDPTKIQAAKQKAYNAEYSAKDEVQQVSLYQAQARLVETSLAAAQARLVALQNNPMTANTSEGKEAIGTMQRYVNKLQTDFSSATATAKSALDRLPQYTPPGATTGTARPPLSSFGGAQAPPQGLINQTPSP